MSALYIVYANAAGEVFDSSQLLAAGRTGADVVELNEAEWIPLPSGATLVSLPGSRALGVDPDARTLKSMPKEYSAVGALLPQGYTRLYLPAYYKEGAQPFPLFGYTAVAFAHGRFYVAAQQSDDPALWDPGQYDFQATTAKVQAIQRRFPENGLFNHMRTCALEYECMTSRNTFFGRLEGALPISGSCNAGCVGCISEQSADSGFPSPQTRLKVRPSVDEIVQVMVEHLTQAGPSGIVSFGQGCEGEPTLRGQDIAAAIKRTRGILRTGYINMNTNAGLTSQVKRITDAGLDLMRVSIISALPEHYNAYYRPRGYSLADVEESARYAAAQGVIVSLNYLVFPGVSDREEEIDAMIAFIQRTGVRLVQMRNLNIDPDRYLAMVPPAHGEPIGMLMQMQRLREACPGLRVGSYTHPPEWFSALDNI